MDEASGITSTDYTNLSGILQVTKSTTTVGELPKSE
jgi:hypothetical protein